MPGLLALPFPVGLSATDACAIYSRLVISEEMARESEAIIALLRSRALARSGVQLVCGPVLALILSKLDFLDGNQSFSLSGDELPLEMDVSLDDPPLVITVLVQHSVRGMEYSIFG